MPSILCAFDDDASNVRAKIIVIYALLIAANVAAWIWALVAFNHYPVLLGTAFLAYSFGLRHAVDADHIAAIDNVTRKLMQEGKRPVGIGLFFSLGHSTIVVLASVAVAATATAFKNRMEAFHSIGGIIGTLVSAAFLLLIAAVNVYILVNVYRTFQHVKNGGEYVDEDFNMLMAKSGVLARLLRPMFRMIEKSWHMYPLGFLFGLGFDTATEVGLLGISAASAANGMPIWSILVFPALFTAGMTLIDTTELGADAGGLRLGVRQADPQALLQHDHHFRVGGRGRDRRRHRGLGIGRRPARTVRPLLGHDRRAERQFRRDRLRDHRHLRRELDRLGADLSIQGIRSAGSSEFQSLVAISRRLAGLRMTRRVRRRRMCRRSNARHCVRSPRPVPRSTPMRDNCDYGTERVNKNPVISIL